MSKPELIWINLQNIGKNVFTALKKQIIFHAILIGIKLDLSDICLSSASYEESIFLFQFFVKTTDLFRSSLASTIHATSESQVIGLSFKIEPEVKVGLDLPCELSFYTLNAWYF